MKITIKTIKGDLIPLDVEPENKISDIKEKIQAAKGIEISTQKLVVKGKQAEDAQTLKDLQIKEGDFMVVMVIKKPATSQVPSSNNVPTQQTQQIQPTQESQPAQTVKAQPVTQPQITTSLNPNTQSTNYDSSSALLTGTALEKTIDEICSMGFEKPKVIEALKAAFNNPDRAIDYLFNGIPSNIAGMIEGTSSQMPGNLSGAMGTQEPMPTEDAEGDNPFAFLKNNPVFQQLRSAIQANPAFLQPALAQLAQSNPQLFQLITQNQEAFIKMLMEGGDDEGPLPSNVIQVTPEEKAAIDRLAGLGFDRSLALEAYLACDKNEELAANYLFERQMAGDFEQANPYGDAQGDDDEEFDDENYFQQ